MKIKLLTIYVFSSLLSIISVRAGQVITDGSMGAATNLTGSNYTISQNLGTTVGNNLFHSFGTFNLSQGDVATFTGANTIQNVISRVTDGNPSSIDGTIQSQVGNANFFFINPAGMVFGQNAQVNVPAAFHASTANELRFADGTAYNLVTPKGSLTAAPPEAFGFLGNTGDIVIEGSQLSFREGTNVSFTGNSVAANSATIKVPHGNLQIYGNGDAANDVLINGELPQGNGAIMINGSRIDLSGHGGGNLQISGGDVSVSGMATIFNVNTKADVDSTMSGITINGGDINISGDSLILIRHIAGNVQINANTLTIDSGEIISETITGSSGDMVINVINNLLIVNNGSIQTLTVGASNAGSITINAGSVLIDGSNLEYFTGVASKTDDIGNAGSVTVNVNGELQIINGGEISSGTWGQGNSGIVNIVAESLLIDGTSSGIYAQTNRGSAGNAGGVIITVNGELQIFNGGTISSSTAGQGNAGIVIVNANNLFIDDRNSEYFTGISSQSNPSSTGNSGSIKINVNGELQILNGGKISVLTATQGDYDVGGSIEVTAGSLRIDGTLTGIFSTVERGTSNAGNIIVNVNGELQIVNGGTISSDTFAQGNAGTINVTANSLLIDGQDSQYFTGISSQTNYDNNGNAGDVIVNINEELRIVSGGTISSDSFTPQSNAGTVNVTAGSLFIDGQNSEYFTGISSTTEFGAGKAGDVIVNVNRELQIINGGVISSSNNGTGDAGTIIISVGNLLRTIGGVITTSAKTGHGGDITITTPAIVLNNSQITTSVTGEGGNGGDITLKGGYLVLDGGFIQANTEGQDAKGGNIFINMDGLLSSGGVTHIGGWKREIFNINSDRNVIQAAANARENYGSITFKNPNDDTASSIGASSNRLEPIRLAKHPCEGIKGRFNFRRRGDVGLPNSGEDIIQSKHPAEIENKATNLSSKLNEQTICAVK